MKNYKVTVKENVDKTDADVVVEMIIRAFNESDANIQAHAIALQYAVDTYGLFHTDRQGRACGMKVYDTYFANGINRIDVMPFIHDTIIEWDVEEV